MLVFNWHWCPFCNKDCEITYVKVPKLPGTCKTFCGSCGVFYGNEKIVNLVGKLVGVPKHLEGFIEYVLGI